MKDPGWQLEDLDLSDATREYLDDLPVSGGPAQVLADWGRRSRQDALEEKVAEKKRQAYEERREELLDQARFEGRDLRDQLAPLRDFEISTAIEDAIEERGRQARVEARAEDLQRRLVQAQADLAKERKTSARATVEAGKARRRAAARTGDSRDSGGYGGVRVRFGGPIVQNY